MGCEAGQACKATRVCETFTFDAGTFDAGSCLSPPQANYTCTLHCASIGLACSESCVWPAGGAAGTAAWLAGQACGGNNSGAAPCGYTWNDAVGAPPRWRCCCQ